MRELKGWDSANKELRYTEGYGINFADIPVEKEFKWQLGASQQGEAAPEAAVSAVSTSTPEPLPPNTRASSVQRLVGEALAGERGEAVLKKHEEAFAHPELNEICKKEREKSAEEVELIRFADRQTSDLLTRYGLDSFSVPPENVHILPESAWVDVFGNTGTGKFRLQHQHVVVRDTDLPKSAFLHLVTHEFLHFKSFQSLHTDIDGNATKRRSGLKVFNAEQPNFPFLQNMDEAMTEEVARRITEEQGIASPAADELEKTRQRRTASAGKTLPDGRVVTPEEVLYMEESILPTGEVRNTMFRYGYSTERQQLKVLIDKLLEAHPDRFASRDAVFDVFVRAKLGGTLLELGRLVDGTFGAGTLRRIGKLDSRPEKQTDFIASLTPMEYAERSSAPEEGPKPESVAPESGPRRSSVSRVVGKGLTPEAKEAMLQPVRDAFADQEYWKTKAREKTPGETDVVRFVNERTNAALAARGLPIFDIPPENVHFIPADEWTSSDDAYINVWDQAILVRGDMAHRWQLAAALFGPMFRFKSPMALQRKDADAQYAQPSQPYRQGLEVHSRRTPAIFLTEINKAVTEELGDQVFATSYGESPYATDLELTEEDQARLDQKAAGEARFTVAGPQERRHMLNMLLEKLVACRPDRFSSRAEAFKVFADAMLSDNLLSLGRIIDGTFGRGTLRGLGEIPSPSEALQYIEELQPIPYGREVHDAKAPAADTVPPSEEKPEEKGAGESAWEPLEDREGTDILARTLAQGSDLRGEHLTGEVLMREGLRPMVRIELGPDARVWASMPYVCDNEGHVAAMVYVPDGEKVIARTYYRSTQGMWRYLPTYAFNAEQDAVERFDEGGSEQLQAPWRVQRALSALADDFSPQELSSTTVRDLAFAGTAQSSEPGASHPLFIGPAQKKILGEFYPRTRTEHIAPESLDFYGGNDGERPDMTKSLATWTQFTKRYGQTNIEALPSRDGSLIYLFCRDTQGRAWIGGIEDASAPLAPTGLRTTWVNGGDLVLPPALLNRQAGTYSDPAKEPDAYVSVYEAYQAKSPVIQEYLTARS